jgi:D-aspartate ligase
MEKEEVNFIPVLVGGDINTYSMARCFYEAYGITSVFICRELLPIVEGSILIKEVVLDDGLLDTPSFLRTLFDVAQKYKSTGKKLVLVGTNDFYVRLIIENKEALSKEYSLSYIDASLMENLLVKANFYKLCEKHGIETPKTYFYSCKTREKITLPFNYPVILKPSNGVAYLKRKFIGQQKVYKINSDTELKNVVTSIEASGYDEDLIIQDFIPGDDTAMWDSVFYCDTHGKAKLISFAQVVLQEHTPTAIGNYTALISRYNEEMMMKLKKFLEELGYVGFANFDMKYDLRDGTFKIFEVNIRQGRSSYYVTACGYNLAKYLVDDIIYKKDIPLALVNKKILFSVVPKFVIRNFVSNKAIRDEAVALMKEGAFINPLFYEKEKSLKRLFYLFLRQLNYVQKYYQNKW